jgi:hypothetical protein
MKSLKFTTTFLFLAIINSLIAQTFTYYNTATTSTALANNIVHDIAIDAQGNKWFCTDCGVSKFDGTNWTNYTTVSGLRHSATLFTKTYPQG